MEGAAAATFDGSEGERAAALYRRIFLGYGDDSVAQLGGVHVACEWVSNIMTKALQRGRLASYLEQSTRYIAYDSPMPGPDGAPDSGGYRYWRDPELGPAYEAAMNSLFETYSESLVRVEAWAAERFPRGEDEPEAAHARSLKAKALDLLRGLLPAASLSHVGIYASGQAYEQLILRLLASPLPEAREMGAMILRELQQVIPSFVARVEKPDRGGEWVEYLANRAVRRPADHRAPRARPAAGAGRGAVGAAALDRGLGGAAPGRAAVRGHRGLGGGGALAAVRVLPPDERATLIAELVGDRRNRRHRPGRGFEALRYRFEVVSDYGAFRDIQRHRMLTIQWQPLTPDLGAGVPEELDEAGVGDDYRAALDRSRAEYERLIDAGHAQAAPYALCLGYRIRYILDMNAREAMHLIELRSGREGHPAVPGRGPRAARADRRRAPGRRRRDDLRRLGHRAPARAHPVRDPDACQDRRRRQLKRVQGLRP